jgi:(R,R)-butanediol dehydrogenase/meso-butanediol dehydrogenase/diacetyl reductase
VEAVWELTGGRGADASVDAAGVPATLHTALESTYLDGEVVLVAITTQPVVLDMSRFRRFAVHLTSTGSQTPDAFHDVIRWMQEGRYPVDGWTETIAFDDLITEGFEPLHRQEKMKVVVDLATAARST